MHHITRGLLPSLFTIPGRRALVGAAVACVAALALGGTAIADIIFESSPPVAGTTRIYHVIKAKHSGLHLNVPAASTKNGTEIIQWNGTNAMNEQWEFKGDGFTYVSIRNRWSRQCLDVDSKAEGPVVQRPCDGTISQRWTTKPTNSAFYVYFTNQWSGLDLNIAGGSTENGAKLIQWPHVESAPNALFNTTALSVVD